MFIIATINDDNNTNQLIMDGDVLGRVESSACNETNVKVKACFSSVITGMDMSEKILRPSTYDDLPVLDMSEYIVMSTRAMRLNLQGL